MRLEVRGLKASDLNPPTSNLKYFAQSSGTIEESGIQPNSKKFDTAEACVSTKRTNDSE
jgi:hypothetical protein